MKLLLISFKRGKKEGMEVGVKRIKIVLVDGISQFLKKMNFQTIARFVTLNAFNEKNQTIVC